MKNKLLICILCLLLCTGCWDKSELEDHTFVVMMGIDKADNENVTVTVAFPLTQAGSGGSKDESEYSTMSASAPSVVEALNLFGTKLAGPLSFFSTKSIVISEELARDARMLRRVLSSWRYEQMRKNTNVLISSCKASGFIKARLDNPVIDILRQEDLILEHANFSAYYTAVQFLDLIINLKTGTMDGAAMYGGLAEGAEEEGKQQQKQNEEDKEEQQKEKTQNENQSVKSGYLPGELPLEADNKSQICGLAIFSDGKMVGTLSSDEAQVYAMMTRSRTRKIMTLPDPLDSDGSIVVSILPNGKSKIRGYLTDAAPVFDITVNLNCVVENITKDTDYTTDENYAVLTEYITQVCTENMQELVTKLQGLNADILHLGDKLMRHFPTTREWDGYNWRERYGNAEIRVHVNLSIDRAGVVKA